VLEEHWSERTSLRQRRVDAPLGKVGLPSPLSWASNLAFTMVSDSARASKRWSAPSRDLLDVQDLTCSLHDKKPSTSSAPATCRFLFDTLKESVPRVRGGLSRARAASGARGSSGRQVPRLPSPWGFPLRRLHLSRAHLASPHSRALPLYVGVFFSYLVSCCVFVALSCLLRTAAPSVRCAQGGGESPSKPPAGGSRLGGGAWCRLGWFLRAPLRSVLPSTLDTQSPRSFWHFSTHSRALVVVLGVLTVRMHDLKNRLGSAGDTPPACFCMCMWFCTGKRLPTCCFFSLVHSLLLVHKPTVLLGWGCAVEARPWPLRLLTPNPLPGLVFPSSFQH